MSEKEELEKNLAAQIRILQKLRDLETRAGGHLETDALDSFDKLRQEMEPLVSEAFALQQANVEFAAKLKAAGGQPTETLKKLDSMVRSLSSEVTKANKNNLDQYVIKARNLSRRLKHVHKGQNALATYKNQAQKTPVPPAFKKQT